MASFIERGTCDCVIDALMMSVIIGVSISMHWVNTHEGRGSRAHVFVVFFSISDTSFTPHVRNSSNVFLYNTDSVRLILVADR